MDKAMQKNPFTLDIVSTRRAYPLFFFFFFFFEAKVFTGQGHAETNHD
jgi:hypothetical protein